MFRSIVPGLLLASLFIPNFSAAVVVTIDNTFTITDGSTFDLCGANDIICFDSFISGPIGSSGYDLKGTVTAFGSGGSLINLPNASVLSLTNFVADVNGALPGTQVVIDFSHQYVVGIVNGNFADGLNAEVANGFNEPLYFNGPNSLAVPVGTDVIDDWYGYVSGAVILPPVGSVPPLLNPAQAAGGGSSPYAFYGHGPQFFSTFDPVVGGHLEFTLGSSDSQLILPSSAEVGFSIVPLPAGIWLFFSSLFTLACLGRRYH